MTALDHARIVGDAVEVLPYDVDRATWLRERARGIGGSDASTIAGVNPWSSRYELWLDKTGRAGEQEVTVAMRMGHVLEPVMRQLFTEDTGIEVTTVGLLRNTERPWQQVSLDGLTADGGIFESKTTNWRMASEWDEGQVSDHAEIQVQHGLAVTGLPHAWVVALVDGRDFHVRKVIRDERLIASLTAMELTFWTEHVLTDTVPPLEASALPAVKDRWSIVDAESVAASEATVAPLLEGLELAKADVKIATARKDLIEAQLRDLIGGAEVLTVLGEPVATCKANGTFAAKRFQAEHPELAATYVKDVEVLDVDRLKAEHPDLYNAHRARVLRPVNRKKES